MNETHQKTNWRELLLWFALLILALYLRGHDLRLTPIWGDMPNFVNTAMPITAGEFPLAGRQWSVGIDKAPLSIYLIAIPLFISQSPLFLIGCVALLNTAAVGGSYWFTRRYFGRRAAAIAMLLFAINPWSVHYIARVVWEPSLIPPFTLLFIAALFAAIIEEDSRALILAFVALACLLQIHPSTMPLAAVLGIALLLFRRRWRVSAIIIGLLAALLIISPYIYHDYTLNFANARRLLSLATSPTATQRQLDLYPARLAAIMATGLRYGDTIPHLEWLDYLTMTALWGSVGYLLLIIWQNWRNNRAAVRPCTLGLSQSTNRAAQTSRRFDFPDQIYGSTAVTVLEQGAGVPTCGRFDDFEKALPCTLLILWFATPIVATLYRSVHLIPHYFIILQPAQFIIIGIAAAAFLRHATRNKTVLVIVASIFGVIITLQVYVSWRVPQHMAQHGVLQTAGMPLQFHLDLTHRAERISRTLDDAPIHVIYDTNTSRAAARDFYPCFRYVNRDAVELRFSPQAFTIPDTTRDLIFLLAPNQPVAAEILTEWGEEIADTRVAALGGEEVFKFYRLPAPRIPNLRTKLLSDTALAKLANGVEILDCTFPKSVVVGANIPVITTWHIGDFVPTAPPDKGYTLFTHLLDYQQDLVAQKDMLVYEDDDRAVGDITINWYNLAGWTSALPGRYHLALGMYTFPSQHRAHIVDGARAGENHLLLEPINIHSAAYAPTRADLQLDYALDWQVGENIAFLGYNLNEQEYRAGADIRVTLYWQAHAALDRDYTVFVHLLDEQGQLRAQHDSQPQNNAYPTTAWQPGEIIEDAHVLTIPADIANGDYHLVAGMYYWETGERLPVYDANGEPRGDSVTLMSNE